MTCLPPLPICHALLLSVACLLSALLFLPGTQVQELPAAVIECFCKLTPTHTVARPAPLPSLPQVQELLARIEAGGILPPLVVLQVLSKSPTFRLSLVKDYVTRQLQADSR